MEKETTHLAVEEVSEDDADVTLQGPEAHIFDLLEYVDIDTLLQNELISAEEELDSADVEVTPHKGLRGFDSEE